MEAVTPLTTSMKGPCQMAKKRIPSEHLRRKVLLLCEDANTLADDIKHLANTAQNEHAALLLAAKASEITVSP